MVYMPWFTKHNVEHAENVANMALKLASKLEVDSQALDLVDKYLLCSAALLHDIGMNDLAKSKNLSGEMTEEDYATIRKQHAKRSGEMIISDRSKWGLPALDSILAQTVGLIAQAHGTSEYAETIPALKDCKTVKGTNVKAPTLAAILLMADELDLDYERAGDKPEALNSVSAAHDFKHRCIGSADIDLSSRGEVEIILELSIPEELTSEDREAIESWIVSKLRRQISLVEPQIGQGFPGRPGISRAIKVDYRNVPNQAMPSREALSIIRSEAATDRLIDLSESLDSAKKALRQGRKLILLIGEWDRLGGVDIDGREDLLDVLAKQLSADGTLVLSSRRLALNSAGEASDVLEEWVEGIPGGRYRSPAQAQPEDTRRRKILDRLLRGVSALPREAHILLTLSFIEGMDDDVRRWLLQEALPAVQGAAPSSAPFVITASGQFIDEAESLEPVIIEVGNIDLKEVEDYLKQYAPGRWTNAVSGGGLRYNNFKNIAINLEKDLRGG
ncbi:HD domain-containing protein [Streptomyces sp. NPDC005483]|uniref:HD domain-containing protein n=1 Tax=Streptomyces sp. NPDC005483 TaxID=3154882 RepID=UPI0033B9BED2